MSSFATYLIGFIVLIVGLALAAYLLNVPTTWIAVGIIVLVGIGILSATSRTKMRDPSIDAGTTHTTIVDRRPPNPPTA
ncbi:MAG TPA: hypothetical protein VHB25_19660 [Gemmatimonadaceae bacterium]|nr:hypothetical protein [Gemmatimonadaceae bacterium]